MQESVLLYLLHLQQQRRDHRHGLLPIQVAVLVLGHDELAVRLEHGHLAHVLTAGGGRPRELPRVPRNAARAEGGLLGGLGAARRRLRKLGLQARDNARRVASGLAHAEGRGQRRAQRGEEGVPLFGRHNALIRRAT